MGAPGNPQRSGDVGRIALLEASAGPSHAERRTMGKVHSKLNAGTLRQAIYQVYGCLKRKALPDDAPRTQFIEQGGHPCRR